MDPVRIKRFTYIINSIILFLVFALAGFFYLSRAAILIWFSIPTALVYIIGYFLIRKDRLDIYVRLVYFWLTIYMCLCTFCLGNKIGFHLYCLSMIPIIFYTEYMADKLGKRRINAFVASGIIGICYLLSTGYASYYEPLYNVDTALTGVFWVVNSAIVLSFLVLYSRFLLSLIGDYEGKLKDAALIDRLTGLYNRHYMMEKLEKTYSDNEPKFITMIDIDDFKKINDRYGHNAGDYVLINVARIMREVCEGCDISRWGGEEFLIFTTGNLRAKGLPLIEKLRQRVESENFVFGEEHIKVTITSGLAEWTGSSSVDKWVSEADDNLYTGKKTGKNKVVC